MKIYPPRPQRLLRPLEANLPRALAPVPQLPNVRVGGLSLPVIVTVLGSLAGLTLMIVYAETGPLLPLVGALVVAASGLWGLGLAWTARARATRGRNLKRERYLDYLANLRLSLAKSGAEARTIANLIHPEPGLLPQMIADPTRLWERRPSDSDFLQVRIGQGTTLWSPLVADTDPDPAQGFDPVLMAEAAEAIRTAGLVDAMPICLDLGLGSGEIALIGPREATENLARALVAQLACFHSPADVGIVVVGEQAPAWPGLDRLPHYQTPSVNDLMSLLTREVSTRPPHAAKGLGWLPHLVIIVDEHGRSAQPFPKADLGATELGITVIHLIDHPLDGPSEQAAVVTVDANHQIGFEPVGAPAHVGQADLVSTGFFEALTRSLAPYSLEEAHGL